MFETRIFAGAGHDVGAIIAQAIVDNPLTAGRMGLKAFEKVLRRAAGKTGSTLFKEVRAAFTVSNPYGLTALARHPSGKLMSPLVDNYYAKLRGFRKPKPFGGYAPGKMFRGLMQYRMTPDSPMGVEPPPGPPNVEIGLIPERRGGKEWAEKFRKWQVGGAIVPDDRTKRATPVAYGQKSMYAMLAALGLPVTSRQMTAPKREVMEQVEAKENPLALFQKNLYERLG